MRPTLVLMFALLLAGPAAALVEFDWALVGDPGNACDPQSAGCFGAVAERYRISKREVTNAQYAEFLNAVAVSDTNGLYNTSMGSGLGGITRSGGSGAFVYTTIAGRADMPVSYVSFYDAARFANWLHNGQPTGPQNVATTEDGAYTLSPGGISSNSIVRNPGALVFVPSEDEWYKAAYYSPSTRVYFDYPARSDDQTTCAAAGAVANTANCNDAVTDFTDVASYTRSGSPVGTFDQGGNVSEWNERRSSVLRGRRGGHLGNAPGFLAAATRGQIFYGSEVEDVGFRVASVVPPPPVPSIGPTGIALLGCLLGLVGVRFLRRAESASAG